jgi:hypothetical protein
MSIKIELSTGEKHEKLHGGLRHGHCGVRCPCGRLLERTPDCIPA